MYFKARLVALVLVFTCLAALQAGAQNTDVSFGPLETFADGGTLKVTIAVDAANSSGATLVLTGIFGDLNDTGETVKVSADGTVIGSFGEFGGEDCQLRPDQVITIPQSTLAQLTIDGRISLSFSASGAVDVCDSDQPNLRLSGVVSIVTSTENIVNSALATNRNFMRRRADSIVSADPDVGQFHARLSNSSPDAASSLTAGDSRPRSVGLAGKSPRFDDGKTASEGIGSNSPLYRKSAELSQLMRSQPLSLSGRTGQDIGRYSFFTSLSQIQKATLAQQAAKTAGTSASIASGGTGNTALSLPSMQLPFDIWAQGQFSRFRDDIGGGDRKGHTGLVFVGADYVLTSSVIAGALVQFDFAEDKSSVLGTQADGHGWMTGPYISARIARNVFLDLRATWGRSNNESNPGGPTTDKFATRRHLLSANLSGNWHHGATRLTPSVSLKHFRETQDSYLSGSGVVIPSQEIRLGRFAFGAELGHSFRGPNKFTFEPHVSLQGIWDFDGDDTATVGGFVVSTQKVRGKVGGGFRVTNASGVSLLTSGTYDGLGDKDFDAYQGQVFVVVPFN